MSDEEPGVSTGSATGERSTTWEVERAFREEHGRVIASLVRRFGDIDIAEEAAGEALLVPLPEQDRGGWDRDLVAEGHALVRECLAINRPGRYQVLAAINAVHTDAPTAADTDWSQVVALYDQLTAIDPSPIVALNRAVALAELDGPEVALAIIDRLDLQHPTMTSYHAWHVARADLLRRLSRSDEAKAAYDAALATCENTAERAHLTRKRGELV